jgi:hypothetical protein
MEPADYTIRIGTGPVELASIKTQGQSVKRQGTFRS